MTDPSTDPVGTVRDFPRWEEPSYSTYSAHCAVRWTDDRAEFYPWLLLNSEGPQRLSHDAVEGCRVIGAVPGTPAATTEVTVLDLTGILTLAADLGTDSWDEMAEHLLHRYEIRERPEAERRAAALRSTVEGGR